MATFQVVYDDFSGGQYMGMRQANQPKNTWNGNNVITNANGELIPVGTRTCATYAGSAGTTGSIRGHYNSNATGWVFATHGTTSRMLRYSHTNGTAFPTTTTNTTLNGLITSNIAYSHLDGTFFYGGTASSVNRLYSINPTGSVQSSISWSGATAYQITGVFPYKYRLLLTTTIGNRLHYTSANTGSRYGANLDPAKYYEFNSTILNVYPRTEDVLVVCEDGMYSLTGTIDSSVNIQLLATTNSIILGQADGCVVNRNLFYLDSSRRFAGASDGRLYRFAGITSQPIASFEYGDYNFDATGKATGSPSDIVATSNSRLVITFRNGVTYFESVSGVFAKADIWELAETSTSLSNTQTFKVAEPTTTAPDDYIMTAVVDTTNSASPITIYRTIINSSGPVKLDANFSTSTSSPTVNPTGTVKLSEYWHNKPFTVKEVFIEYSITTGGSVSCTILPTGVVDVPAANLASVASTAASETSPPAGDYRMYRYWPNNAAKGFGVIPELTITNCFVKRVILNCED